MPISCAFSIAANRINKKAYNYAFPKIPAFVWYDFSNQYLIYDLSGYNVVKNSTVGYIKDKSVNSFDLINISQSNKYFTDISNINLGCVFTNATSAEYNATPKICAGFRTINPTNYFTNGVDVYCVFMTNGVGNSGASSAAFIMKGATKFEPFWFSSGTRVFGNGITGNGATVAYSFNTVRTSPDLFSSQITITTKLYNEYINGTISAANKGPFVNYGDGLTSQYLYISGKADATMSGSQYLCEMILYNTDTTNIKNEIEGYLAWKWNLVSKLPSNHPYKNVSTSFIPYIG